MVAGHVIVVKCDQVPCGATPIEMVVNRMNKEIVEGQRSSRVWIAGWQLIGQAL